MQIYARIELNNPLGVFQACSRVCENGSKNSSHGVIARNGLDSKDHLGRSVYARNLNPIQRSHIKEIWI
jgi:hypothetical protein